MHLWSFGGGVELRLGRVQQFLPGLLELLYALVLEHDEDVGQVDAHGLELVEDLLRLRGPAGDRIAGDDAKDRVIRRNSRSSALVNERVTGGVLGVFSRMRPRAGGQ